jgi:transposase
MERVLWLYALAYRSEYPVLCFDERPCQLLGEVMAPLPAKPGAVRKEHATYERNGTCALLAAIEPLTGRRFGVVTHQRTKKEYTEFCQMLAAQYPDAKKIRLVQDNLNTHHAGSFYEHLSPEEAFALAQRFEFYYTPKSASWLNMIEIEFSALARLCLKRRIADIETLARQVTTLIKERNKRKIKICWQFSIQTARTKMRSHYTKLRKTK